MLYQGIYQLDDALVQMAQQTEEEVAPIFARIDRQAERWGMRVLKAFSDHRVSAGHLTGTTGYGYDDRGRDTLDKIYAQVFGAEDALVRHTFVSGTHALVTALFGVLRPGDLLLSVTGAPYDTMEEAVGIRGAAGCGSLRDWGVRYASAPLREDGSIDLPEACRLAKGARLAYLQRSRGYSLRPSLTVEEIGRVIAALKAANPGLLVMVDNCYGEFVQDCEPVAVGADLMAGSLIKNPGGGLARTGGYIAGRADLIELCANRLTCPGMGREVGCSLDELRAMYLGFFFAPTTVASALKTAVFAAGLFSRMGLEVTPRAQEERSDIIQAVLAGSPQRLEAFCRGIQAGAPVDSFVTPEAWDMPGYEDPVIMAAGAFTMGASIELSADGPMREPYAAWMQGGLTYPSGKAGVLLAAQQMRNLL